MNTTKTNETTSSKKIPQAEKSSAANKSKAGKPANAKKPEEEEGVNAIALLRAQHREVEGLFDELEDADTFAKKEKFGKIADALAVHASIEEMIFYPGVRGKDEAMEALLLEALEEHLGVKRIIADLLETKASDETFDAKVKVLREQVEHHVEEEENEIFPKAKKQLKEDVLVRLGAEMSALQEGLEAQGSPRDRVMDETKHAADL